MQDNIIRDWLHRRKISDTVLKEFKIFEGHHPMIGECIVIPITDSYNKYRRHPLSSDTPKYISDKGAKVTLYGADKIADKSSVLITEGEFDALVAWSANIPAVSSTGGALTFQKEWADLLAGKELTICFDNDGAGGEGMVKALEILPWAKILLLPDRPGVKDISDYVTNGGDLHSLMSTARTFTGLDEVFADRGERLATWQSTFFHDAYIKHHTKPTYAPRARGEASNDVKRAKEYPITDLIKFNRMGNAVCIFHAEDTPSLHYYPKTNSCYCFGGCGRAYDAIDIYRKLYGVSFVDAVKKLQ